MPGAASSPGAGAGGKEIPEMSNVSALTLVAFGDSITAATRQEPADRWPEILQRALRARFPGRAISVVNAGMGGNTTREGLRRMEPDVLRHRPRLVLIEFGNDATTEPGRHVPLDEFRANLDLMRARVAERAKGRIVLLTFPPIIDPWHCRYGHEFYRDCGGPDAYQEQYRELTRQFARETGVPLVDIAKALRQAIASLGPEEYILKDGVHLTVEGNRLVARHVLECLAPEIAGMIECPDPDGRSADAPRASG